MTGPTLYSSLIGLSLQEFSLILKYIDHQVNVKRAKLKSQFKSRYQKYHGQVKDVEHVLEELIMRLMFEFLDGVVTYRDLLRGEWFLKGLRDTGHDLRMKKLVNYLCRNKKDFSKNTWFDLQNAICFRKIMI